MTSIETAATDIAASALAEALPDVDATTASTVAEAVVSALMASRMLADPDMKHCYAEALDEVFHLRRAAAYEARVSEAHGEYKTFPKSRRSVLETQIMRLREVARGKVVIAYAGMHAAALDSSMRDADAPLTLTRAAYEASLPWRRNTRPDHTS